MGLSKFGLDLKTDLLASTADLGACHTEGDGCVERFKQASERLDAYIAELEAVETAAAKWYEKQLGTMAANSPSGLAVRDALDALKKRRGS